ncbi:MAG: calcium-binding protein [Pseudomonadota bacterium]
MRPNDTSRFDGETINLNLFQIDDLTVFIDLDAETAGALTGDAPPSQTGFLRIGESELTLNDVENIIGTDAGERLFGSEEDGFILAGGGDDTVHPFNGDDFVDGGDGVDTLLLNAIDGPLIVDLKRGFADTADQTNEITGFENVTGSNLFSDVIRGDGGDNVLSGGAGGDDRLIGRGGDDMLLGEAGEDRLVGGGGADMLFGGDGGDRLAGGKGRDELYGGADDDRLIAGKGADLLFGGEGGDRFIFGRKDGDNTISDFSFEEGDSLKFRGKKLIDSDEDLLDFVEMLAEDNRVNTNAEVDGDDLVIRYRQTEVTLENFADGWLDAV